MNFMNKKGEFFILTAVIISAVLVSLAVVKNEVISNSEPASFYDLTYEIKQESASVIDYGINKKLIGLVNKDNKEFDKTIVIST